MTIRRLLPLPIGTRLLAPPVRLLLGMLLAAVAAYSGASFAQCSRTLRYNLQDWRPYSFSPPKGSELGLDVEVLLAVAKEAQCQVEFTRPYPAARAFQMFRDGQLDVVTGLSHTAERAQFIRYTRPYRDEVIALFRMESHQNSTPVRHFEDLIAHRLALLAPLFGYYGADYEAAVPQLQRARLLNRVEGTDKALRMLAAGRGDLVMGDATVLQYTADRMGVGALDRVELEPNRNRIHLGLSMASTTEDDRQLMDAALRRLEAQGTVAAIMRRYGTNEHRRRP